MNRHSRGDEKWTCDPYNWLTSLKPRPGAQTHRPFKVKKAEAAELLTVVWPHMHMLVTSKHALGLDLINLVPVCQFLLLIGDSPIAKKRTGVKAYGSELYRRAFCVTWLGRC